MRTKLLLCLAMSLGLGSASSQAAPCLGCPALDAGTIVTDLEVELTSRTVSEMYPWIPKQRDHLEMDAGDCEFRSEAHDPAQLIESYLTLRGGGEVWNCPDSKSSNSVRATVSEEDRTTWSNSTKTTGGINLLIAKMGFELLKKRGGSHGIRETTDLSMTIEAAPCYRIPWLAYLRVGRFELEFTASMIQHWVWWTKNGATGAAVHAKGSYEQICDATDGTIERKAPIMWHVHRAQHGCAGCNHIVPKDLGWAPPIPSSSPPPPLPPDVVWPGQEDKPKTDGDAEPVPEGAPKPDGDDDDDDGPPEPILPPEPIVPPGDQPPVEDPKDG